MKARVWFECSERVTQALRARGIDAYSVDLKPSEIADYPYHIQGDVRDDNLTGVSLLIAHPDCTYIASSGLHWNHRRPERQQQTEESLRMVTFVMSRQTPSIGLENPIGCISTCVNYKVLGFEKQIIQPHQFGEDASKATCLFLKGLPKLTPTQYVEPRIVNGKKRWGNQTDSGQNKLTPSEHRKADRARTYPGIADAMATQWGDYLLSDTRKE